MTALSISAQGSDADPMSDFDCNIDLDSSGHMKDIISNALMLGLERRAAEVESFLQGAETAYARGQDLLKAAAQHFRIDEARLSAEVERFRHCNCAHAKASDIEGPSENPRTYDALEVSFASNVMLHVVLHELGHALIREFDLPVLGNEETMADAFATHYLTTHLPEHALAVLIARTKSLLIEAAEVPREEWSVDGEHDNDARRANLIAALALAADATRYAAVADVLAMSESDRRNATDYGTEIHRSWRRILAPLWMPAGMASNEARVAQDPADEFSAMLTADLIAAIEHAVRRFDWHSQVTIHFAAGDGGAAWNRSKRTITVASAYCRRFLDQARTAVPETR